MVNKTIYSIFKQGSRTFFYTSLSFPDAIKPDVFVFYSFVRKADNFVDQIPQPTNRAQLLREKYTAAAGVTSKAGSLSDTHSEGVYLIGKHYT